MMTKQSYIKLLAAVTVAIVVSALVSNARGGPGDDLQTEPVPVPEYVDDARSFVTELDFTAEGTATQASVTVANVATPGTNHLIPDLALRSLKAGQVVRSVTLPHPSVAGGKGGGDAFQPGRVHLLAPFDAEVEHLELAMDNGPLIVTVDTSGAIKEHCKANPSDPQCLEADLSVDAVQASGEWLTLVGKPSSVSVTATVSNTGPDGPVDGIVTRTLTGDAGLLVTPDVATVTTDSLAVGAPRSYTDTYSVTCVTPGAHTLTATTSVTPKAARVVDADATDDSRTATLAMDCAIPIAINIKPGNVHNDVNASEGAMRVAALTTTAGEYGLPVAFDATRIEPFTLRFGSPAALQAGTGAFLHGRINAKDSKEPDDRTQDGDADAELSIKTRAEALAPGDTEGCMLGRAGGLSFYGCDRVTVRS